MYLIQDHHNVPLEMIIEHVIGIVGHALGNPDDTPWSSPDFTVYQMRVATLVPYAAFKIGISRLPICGKSNNLSFVYFTFCFLFLF